MEIRDYSDEIGRRYGRLTVIEIQKVKGGKALAICKCDCGNKRTNRLTYEQYKELTKKGYRYETIKDRIKRKGMTFEKAVSLPLYSHEKA